MCKMHKFGGIAQLGERLNGIQEVSGSIPLISTKKGRKNGLFSQENKPFPLKKFRPFFLRGGIEPMMTDVRLFLQAHEWNPH